MVFGNDWRMWLLPINNVNLTGWEYDLVDEQRNSYDSSVAVAANGNYTRVRAVASDYKHDTSMLDANLIKLNENMFRNGHSSNERHSMDGADELEEVSINVPNDADADVDDDNIARQEQRRLVRAANGADNGKDAND